METGSKTVTMDSKGRITMPAKYRDEFTQFMMVQSPIAHETCLFIYSMNEWNKVIDQFNKLPSTEKVRKMKRKFVGDSETMLLDGNGRFLIKPEFRKYAHLEKKVKFLADGLKIELWDEDVYQQVVGECDEEDIKIIESIIF